MTVRAFVAVVIAAVALAGCSGMGSARSVRIISVAPPPAPAPIVAGIETRGPSDLDGLIAKYAALYEVPESLIRQVIVRESGYNPKARNGPYYGLMQISLATAQSMGYRGPASGLLDAETNLKYAVKYLAGAYLVAGNSSDGAMRNYSRGYYYDAKAKGLLEEVGLR